MIPKWFLRSRFWYMCMFQDEYMARDVGSVFLAIVILYYPGYVWGTHINREWEIQASHTNYHEVYAPRRNRLTHSLIFEEFEMHMEEWRKLLKEDAEDNS